MTRQHQPLQVFNRGRVSKLALARNDLERVQISAEIQTNWMPRALGSMMLRPGFGYLGNTRNNAKARYLPFIFSSTDTAKAEFTSTAMRVWVQDAVVTRANSTAAITGGTFTSTDLTGWTSADQSGSSSVWFAGNFMSLKGTRFARAKRYQSVTAASGTHGLAVEIERGRVALRVGSSVGGDDYFAEATLRPGAYSLAITSTGNFTVEFASNTEYRSLVKAAAIESSGDMVVPSTWSSSDLAILQGDQSADVIFVASAGVQQKRIERYGTESWGVASYEPEDGPFRTPNISARRLTPSARTGDITLECDQPLFDGNHVGALFRITSIGQDVSVDAAGTNQFSDSIRVSGVGDGRQFSYVFFGSTGAYVGNVRIQRSIGEEGSWEDIASLAFAANSSGAATFKDGLDNQLIFYRIGIGSTYTSGTAVCSLSYSAGGLTGVARINSVTASTESSASVLRALGSTVASETWSEGDWSDYRGWPSAVGFHEGRLGWAGKGKIWASVSDGYESFDPDVEGDAGPINRSIASGGVDTVAWLKSLGRLIVGTDSREMQAKTGALDEPLTPSNFNLRDISTLGSAPVDAIKIDNRVLFVQRSRQRIQEISYSGDNLDYATADRTLLVPEIGEPAVIRLAVQRQPDTRVHAIRETTGTAGVLVSEPAENVGAWLDVETDGVIEDCIVLPSSGEDAVYYAVAREINGSTVRFLERWAREDEARGGAVTKLADAHLVQHTSNSTDAVYVAHLIGETVCVWGATADLGSTYLVESDGWVRGIAQASTTFVVGLPYEAWYKSAKLAYAQPNGSALTQRKKINELGVVGADLHAQGLQYGNSTGTLYDLPLLIDGTAVSTDTVYSLFDQPAFGFPGVWHTDSRLVLRAASPRPCTLLAAVIDLDTKPK